MAIISKSPFPNIPDSPGVPAIPRGAALPGIVQSIFGIIEGQFWQNIGRQQVWGIFDKEGTPVAIADSVLDVSYRNESKISGFPVQAGSFANYNKVNNPFEARVTLVKGSNSSQNPLENNIFLNGLSAVGRGDFLKAIDEAAKSLDLYTIVTPERNYINANIEGYDYRRESGNGANLIIVELRLIEIRQVTPQYAQTTAGKPDTSKAQEPQAKPSTNSGKIATKVPGETVAYKIGQWVKGLF